MKKVELLAPSGSLESLYAAVYEGADAVYMGGSKFSARAYASNFTDEDLKKALGAGAEGDRRDLPGDALPPRRDQPAGGGRAHLLSARKPGRADPGGPVGGPGRPRPRPEGRPGAQSLPALRDLHPPRRA